MNYEQVLKILHDELERAEEIEASVGVPPTAQEALISVIDQIALLVGAEIIVA